jgi:hypothetical protein
MTAGQRRFHAILWPLLGPAVVAVLVTLVLLRPSAQTTATGAQVGR